MGDFLQASASLQWRRSGISCGILVESGRGILVDTKWCTYDLLYVIHGTCWNLRCDVYFSLSEVYDVEPGKVQLLVKKFGPHG